MVDRKRYWLGSMAAAVGISAIPGCASTAEYQLKQIAPRVVVLSSSSIGSSFSKSLEMGLHDINQLCRVTGLSLSRRDTNFNVALAEKDCAKDFVPKTSSEHRIIPTITTPGYKIEQIGGNVLKVSVFGGSTSSEGNVEKATASLPSTCTIIGFAISAEYTEVYYVTEEANCASILP